MVSSWINVVEGVDTTWGTKSAKDFEFPGPEMLLSIKNRAKYYFALNFLILKIKFLCEHDLWGEIWAWNCLVVREKAIWGGDDGFDSNCLELKEM
ncbi:hypothetical protein [Desulfonatronum lacustre]|uniref:hypothetical protein n=1 Tax=Desulfonatronum lacustre TaxID=66849 RepID=UPI00048FA0A3|nr:hypothetical protein [Desulfonatronum lacustre]